MSYRYRQQIEEGGGLTWLRKHYKLTPSELFVLDNLIKHDHPENGCFPSIARIATETGLHLTNVQRALASLTKKELIERWKPPYRGRTGKLYHYRFSPVILYLLVLAYDDKNPQEVDVIAGADSYMRSQITIAEPHDHNSGTVLNTIAEPTQITIAEPSQITIAEPRSRKLEVGSKIEEQTRLEDSLSAAAMPQNEEKLCACGEIIPPEKVETRDLCRQCWLAAQNETAPRKLVQWERWHSKRHLASPSGPRSVLVPTATLAKNGAAVFNQLELDDQPGEPQPVPAPTEADQALQEP